MNNKLSIILFCSLLVFSCKKSVEQPKMKTDTIAKVESQPISVSDNSQNSLDWAGSYKGITPCADCEGIETELILNSDLTYVIRTKYLGKGDGKPIVESGKFVWDKLGRTIALQDRKGSPSQYLVGENRLIQLDMDGKVITGALAEKYILLK
jgi:uncharacterized lipoprotein NlpE involved in copper resistance